MPIMVKDNKSVLFIHVPKCGGSSFEKLMQKRGWKELLSIRGVNAKNLNFMHCSPQHMHAEYLSLMVRPGCFDHIIAFVREPVERLKSEYAWQLSQSITSLSPSEWIDHVFHEYKKNPFIYDNHIRPQHEFILEGAQVYKLEDEGITPVLDAISPKQKKGNLISRWLTKEKVKQLKKTVKTSSIHEAFEKKASMIKEFYAKDYESFGYPLA